MIPAGPNPGVILTAAVFQAEGRILRLLLHPEGLHARSLDRLNCAGLGMTPSK
jgi:hypothetical protein